MKSFKEYIIEGSSYSNRFDLFNAVAGRIQLNKKAVQYMLPKEEKGKTFRHVTDLKGAEFLITNQDKNIQISASDVAKICAGIETGGSVLLSVSGKPVVWMPSDAYTYLGEGGIRWMDWSQFDNKHNILSKETKYKYFKMLSKYLEHYPDMLKAMYKGGHFSAKELIADQLDSLNNNYFSYGNYFDGFSGERLAENLRKWMKSNKAESKKLLNDILRLQLRWLDGAESELKGDLGKLYTTLRKSKGVNGLNLIQNMYGFSKYDEVVLDHVRVRNMYIKLAENMATYVRKHINLQSKNSKNYHTEIKENDLKQFLSKVNVPFVFLDENCSGKYWIRYVNSLDDKEMAIYNDYLDWLGIKPHKKSQGVQWYVRK